MTAKWTTVINILLSLLTPACSRWRHIVCCIDNRRHVGVTSQWRKRRIGATKQWRVPHYVVRIRLQRITSRHDTSHCIDDYLGGIDTAVRLTAVDTQRQTKSGKKGISNSLYNAVSSRVTSLLETFTLHAWQASCAGSIQPCCCYCTNSIRSHNPPLPPHRCSFVLLCELKQLGMNGIVRASKRLYLSRVWVRCSIVTLHHALQRATWPPTGTDSPPTAEQVVCAIGLLYVSWVVVRSHG